MNRHFELDIRHTPKTPKDADKMQHFERKEGEEATGGIAQGDIQRLVTEIEILEVVSYLGANRKKRTRIGKLIAICEKPARKRVEVIFVRTRINRLLLLQ
jgi:hypothetical protein